MQVCPLTYRRRLTYTESARVTCAAVIRDRFLLSGRDFVCVCVCVCVCARVRAYICILSFNLLSSCRVCAVNKKSTINSIHRSHFYSILMWFQRCNRLFVVSGTRRTWGDWAGIEGTRPVTITPSAPISPTQPPWTAVYSLCQRNGTTTPVLLTTAISFPTPISCVPASHERCHLRTTSYCSTDTHLSAALVICRIPSKFYLLRVITLFRVVLVLAADMEFRGAVQTGASGKWRSTICVYVN